MLCERSGHLTPYVECVVPGLGRQVLLAGDRAKVPVNLISSVRLTNLSMTVFAPSDRLTNLTLEPIVPEIREATLTPLFQGGSSGRESAPSAGEGDQSRLTSAATGGGAFDFHLLSLSTCPDQWMIGTQQVAWLHFQTISNQSSAFVTLNLDDIVGYRLDGTEARNFAPQSGRLVIIGEEPLLEAYFNSTGQPDVMLCSQPATTNVVLSSEDLSAPVGSWSTVQTVSMTNLFQLIQPSLNSPRLFFRARTE